MLEYILLIAWEGDFAWCAVNAWKTDSILKWTLDLLGTRWRQASCLPEPSYNDWDDISCLRTPLCSAEVSKKEIPTRQFLLHTLTHFKYKDCFKWKYFLFAAWRPVWTLIFTVKNVYRMCFLLKSNWGEMKARVKASQFHMLVFAVNKMFPMTFVITS